MKYVELSLDECKKKESEIGQKLSQNQASINALQKQNELLNQELLYIGGVIDAKQHFEGKLKKEPEPVPKEEPK